MHLKENLLVDTDLANRAESFIDLQKQEVEHMTQGSKALVNSVFVQVSVLGRLQQSPSSLHSVNGEKTGGIRAITDKQEVGSNP